MSRKIFEFFATVSYNVLSISTSVKIVFRSFQAQFIIRRRWLDVSTKPQNIEVSIKLSAALKQPNELT